MIASLWPEPSRLMIAIASSSDPTTRTARIRSRNSVLKSSGPRRRVGHAGRGQDGRARGVAAQLHAPLCQRGPTAGRSRAAAAAWTSSCSAALQTPGRCVLALTRISSAMRASAAGVGVDEADAVVMLDHRDRAVFGDKSDQALAAPWNEAMHVGVELEQDRRAPPGRWSGSTAPRRPAVRAAVKAAVIRPARAVFVWKISLPPRRIAAFPDFRQRMAQSIVTFGRAS